MKKINLLFITFILAQHCFAKTWLVGSTRTYKFPSQVSTLVRDGDTVEIDAGIYNSDVAKWTASNLLLKGVGGMAHLKSNGISFGGKAIWVIAGTNTRVENIEFSLCAVPDHNGAGIRQEGRYLTVSHCYFHHNENGILAGTINPSTILIEYTEFAYNGYGDGQSHNLYINNIDTLIFRYNYSHHTFVGHELKSRAAVNIILNNRLSDEAIGTASRSIDLSNGGTAYLIGNIIEQGPQSQNSNLIGFGLEGLTNPAAHEMYAINNTLVNNRSSGSFFSFQIGTALFKAYNNILAGNGRFVLGNYPVNVDTASNVIFTNINSFAFKNALEYDYQLTSMSDVVINRGSNPGAVNGFSLSPAMEYEHPSLAKTRCVNGIIDIGSSEFCYTTGIVNSTLQKLSLYPNPVKDLLTLRLPYSNPTSIEIYSAYGQKILSESDTPVINISNLGKGLYLIIVKQGASILTTHFLKQ
ncbi:MAG: T9SS type A sorting domain-containing protein [Bacteroidota bacterium]|nr:T9SS type A sorting domain-containing protein [Bacteroidota bacterium]